MENVPIFIGLFIAGIVLILAAALIDSPDETEGKESGI